MDPRALRQRLAASAKELGFDAFGVAPVEVDVRADYFKKWIADGMHGDMAWLARNPDRRTDARKVLPEARSLVVVGLNYYQPHPPAGYRIAKYALGADYHDVILARLKELCAVMASLGGEQKPYVDTGPVLEKPVAAAAGLGWQGKSTILIHRGAGTWLFLGVILTTLELEASDKKEPDRCGSCTRCIDACPTAAIIAPYQMDARKCLAYLTIEHKGAIPVEYREALGDRVFGCDDCLDVCPWNKWAVATREAHFAPRPHPPLRETLAWTDEQFLEHFKGTPVERLGLARWRRNALTVLGNVGMPGDLPAAETLLGSPDPMVAEHAAWAVARLRAR
ncbi:MAG: tRNA epoxyqueuosine(34) reductase QueG [Verrucomicrobia bacterium]|jgi:epoxyqueuosine reductase|nr:MAG: tRNA epoxyqueuosine(34) reductase QueG [Verrucomicrobiota bacterium]